MKSFIYVLLFYFSLLIGSAAFAQTASNPKVVITGVRFSYPLVEKWIKDYQAVNPNTTISIEARTTTDPAQYDLLIEAYEPDAAVKESREYLYIGRYALLPVANATSAFAKAFSDKGLNKELFNQVYFSDIYADKKNAKKIDFPYTVYTRLQKAGAPITFAHYFGFTQPNIKGKAISGADEHLIKALLRDTTGVSYSTPGLLYNLETRKPLDGLAVLPVDVDGNGRVSNDEKYFNDLDKVISALETDDLKNIPVEYLHVSISKTSTNPEALRFLHWLIDHSNEDLHHFGYLNPDPEVFKKGKERLLKQVAFN
ncbi:MAG TPA: hypothetical protein VIM65_04930 [Cyclobacteriaceae bacterium]